jgi:hypothetical protein
MKKKEGWGAEGHKKSKTVLTIIILSIICRGHIRNVRQVFILSVGKSNKKSYSPLYKKKS